MKSDYFFPVPHITIRPAELLATVAGASGSAGALGQYGINIGPMIISWLFRYTNGSIENFMGRALQHRRKEISIQRKKIAKAVKKETEREQNEILRQERKAARRARRAEREAKKDEVTSERLSEQTSESISENSWLPRKQHEVTYKSMDDLD